MFKTAVEMNEKDIRERLHSWPLQLPHKIV